MYLEYLNTQRLSCVKPADFKTIEEPREDVFQEYIIMTLYMADFKYPRLLNGNGCLLECVNKEFLWEFKWGQKIIKVAIKRSRAPTVFLFIITYMYISFLTKIIQLITLPISKVVTMNLYSWSVSNRFFSSPACRNCILAVLPLDPNNWMYTFPSVPFPLTSPSFILILYFTVRRRNHVPTHGIKLITSW